MHWRTGAQSALCLQYMHRLSASIYLHRTMKTLLPSGLTDSTAGVLAACTLTLLGFASASHAQISDASAQKLALLQASQDSLGGLIYKGDTFSQKGNVTAPLFRYERRVLGDGGKASLTASHLTSTPQGDALILETAHLGADYRVQRFEAINKQAGFEGSATVSTNGTQVTYTLVSKGSSSTATENVSAPVVTGPSLFGYVLKNWDQLQAGNALPVRFLVLSEKTSYGFDLRIAQRSDTQTVVSMVASSFIIRMAIAPMAITFDTASRKPVRYEGRVPPQENVNGKLKDLDARVEYTLTSPTYR